MPDTASVDATGARRLTRQRRAVLAVLGGATDHPTAAEVFDRVRLLSPGIGPATVYRSLAWLVDRGHALELSLGDGPARYDGNVARHDHLVCVSCGHADDIDVPVPDDLMHGAVSDTGFAVTRYDLAFYGRCRDCQR